MKACAWYEGGWEEEREGEKGEKVIFVPMYVEYVQYTYLKVQCSGLPRVVHMPNKKIGSTI